ncbi:molybdenum cofactor biosynthesis protein MoaE [Parafrigoribacterium soli]|uniref:molybdenum cofactor biosynthesis protein MoaE n=1 Tax=Parafrigoribacterium soli TaxID=3144663 RepID=UPI0032EFC491
MHEPLSLVTDEPIDEGALRRSVANPTAGAVVTFEGIVRNHDHGQSIRSLDYQAHPDAGRILAECCARIAEESGLPLAAAHRVGSLRVGDVALYAVVAASHRKEAFETCERLVEEIKHTIPIWKRQWFDDGASEWVGL